VADFRYRARCGDDPDLFYPIGGGPAFATQIAWAKDICAARLVRAVSRRGVQPPRLSWHLGRDHRGEAPRAHAQVARRARSVIPGTTEIWSPSR